MKTKYFICVSRGGVGWVGLDRVELGWVVLCCVGLGRLHICESRWLRWVRRVSYLVGSSIFFYVIWRRCFRLI